MAFCERELDGQKHRGSNSSSFMDGIERDDKKWYLNDECAFKQINGRKNIFGKYEACWGILSDWISFQTLNHSIIHINHMWFTQ